MAWSIETIYAVSGGTLGFIAFIRDTFASIAATNREKWRVVENEVLSEDSLLAILNDVEYEQRLSNDQFEELELMLAWIKSDAIELQFKRLLCNPYRKHLVRYKNAAESFSNSVREIGGLWHHHNLVMIPGPPSYWKVQGSSVQYVTHVKAADSSADHIRARIKEVSMMRDAYRKLKTLAERDATEYMLPWKW